MKKNLLLISSLLPLAAFAAQPVVSIPMETDGLSRIKEKVSGTNLKVFGQHTDENVAGAVGKALRFDGYSTYVQGEIPAYSPEGGSSFGVWVAPESYPIVKHDTDTDEKISFAGTIDRNSNSGWAFTINREGRYAFECYSGGWPIVVEADEVLPTYEWSRLVAVNDPGNSKIYLYRNGLLVGEAKSLGAVNNDSNIITIGKSADDYEGAVLDNLFQLNTFNGLIDEVEVFDGVFQVDEISGEAENYADLSIPESRFAKDKLRPRYHGMPGANWTNESHGMTFSDGRYHVFFQKNANGPFMSRLHWGHISSENLYDWVEEQIAIAPGEDYDIKGTWSGCVFTDDEITGGEPNIIYTGVDYVKAYIAQASPADGALSEWFKEGVIINGKPSGLSDDFRDPYFFRNGDDAFIIVGTAKNGMGACTLHKYNSATGSWSNDGSIFFAATSPDYGTFWEMPNVTKMENGKWLFTVTPQATSNGVVTYYWTGDIASDGTFQPDHDAPQNIELINGQGYGLLSPTIYQHDGKTIMLGIVPDKLPGSENFQLGWAHLYSFPREISLDENGRLIQKPFSGLEGLRADNGFADSDIKLDGTKAINGVGGRQFEIYGDFEVGNVPFGFNFFKNSKGAAKLSYNPSNNRLSLSLSGINRKVNDQNSFNGNYACILPIEPEPGSIMKLRLFVDGSVADIFINDSLATSVRVFPTDSDADGLEVFSEGGAVNVKELSAWNLGNNDYSGDEPGNDDPSTGDDPDDTGIDSVFSDLPDYVSVYTTSGVKIRNNVKSENALTGLPKGIYIIEGRKIIVK